MTAVNLLMTNRTVPKALRSQIVERWGYDADHRLRASSLRGHVGVTLKAHVPHLLARQHSRISGAVNFVATGTTLQPHWRVLECERTPLVRVAFETTRLVSGECPHLPKQKATVRVVAVRTRHCALWKAVRMRSLKLTPGA